MAIVKGDGVRAWFKLNFNMTPPEKKKDRIEEGHPAMRYRSNEFPAVHL